ncbi:MAG TPA: PAS domain S-box protein, partial [Phenylobacterium sp.]
MSDKSSKPPFGMSPIEPVFNRATRVAKTLFGALDASIVLVDGDLIWRSRDHGDLSGGARFARQIMASGELLWIEDTHLDPEMARSVAVTGSLKLRFYAGAPVRLTDGSVPGVLCVIDREPRPFDATLAKRLQDLADLVADECDRARIAAEAEHNAQELDSARRLLADFVEAIPVTVVMTDRRLGILKVSPRTLRGMGLSEAEVLGRDLLDMAPAYKPIEDVLYRALSGETVKSERYRMPRAGGGWTWVQLEVTPWREADGAVGGLILASHDVTELVVAMKRLQRSDQRLNLVLEMSQMHVYDVDYTTGAIETAGAPNNLYGPGMSFQEIAGSGLEFVDPRDRAMVGEVYRRHIEEGAPCAYEFRVNRPDQEVWVSVNAQLSLGPDGQMRRALGAMQDITERKQTEQALVRAKEEAEAASRAKSTFLATMSHEIRTPLNGVLGMAQAMAADPLDEVQRQRLNVVRQSGETLLAILNDVLDLSKIEAGKLELEETEFNLGELAKGAHAAFTAQAEEKGLAFELEVAPEALGVYVGDSTRVRQIIYNLVSNAVKFTERGKVQVQVSRPDEALVVRVRDSGIGIPDDRLTSLFQKFEQADASTTRR